MTISNATKLDTLTTIARHYLRISTLETRMSDSKDFHEVAVWALHEALDAAFEAGRELADADRAPAAPAKDPAADGAAAAARDNAAERARAELDAHFAQAGGDWYLDTNGETGAFVVWSLANPKDPQIMADGPTELDALRAAVDACEAERDARCAELAAVLDAYFGDAGWRTAHDEPGMPEDVSWAVWGTTDGDEDILASAKTEREALEGAVDQVRAWQAQELHEHTQQDIAYRHIKVDSFVRAHADEMDLDEATPAGIRKLGFERLTDAEIEARLPEFQAALEAMQVEAAEMVEAAEADMFSAAELADELKGAVEAWFRGRDVEAQAHSGGSVSLRLGRRAYELTIARSH